MFSVVEKRSPRIPVITRSKVQACGHSLLGDCFFELRGGRGCLSLVNVVCCQAEVSAKADFSTRGVFVCVTERDKLQQ